MAKILAFLWKLGTSKWTRVVLVAIAAIVLALLLRNVTVGLVGILGAVFDGVFGGSPSDAPRRSGGGSIPNPPLPGNPDSPNNPPSPGTPSGGPRRRRR